MARFEKVKRFANEDITLPTRSTSNSAGYDFRVAEKTIVPSYQKLVSKMTSSAAVSDRLKLDEVKKITSATGAKPTLVPTGTKCKLDEGTYLELSVRSSTPLKYWLILANGVGIIDADYYGNASNDGEIYLQMINLSPFDIVLEPDDVICQGIIKRFEVVEDDNAEGDRTGGFGSTSK